MTDDEHDMMAEIRSLAERSLALSEKSLKANERIERYFFGDGTADEKPGPATRAGRLDGLFFGLDATKLGYRVLLGLAAFVIAMSGLYASARGWLLK